ncbi:sensor histidine kinase [Granulicella sp. 5B5]|uniref:sensor histidine kinase n=1 Tax=Granulicella sp. 5B5 TaxID=1617967 RepID=UPI0015F61A47|nr:histidine kinase [Granulicella sp. 5B5]QMV18392.1 sensor histidine kinase [Granulicella sp. 5B5]
MANPKEEILIKSRFLGRIVQAEGQVVAATARGENAGGVDESRCQWCGDSAKLAHNRVSYARSQSYDTDAALARYGADTMTRSDFEDHEVSPAFNHWVLFWICYAALWTLAAALLASQSYLGHWINPSQRPSGPYFLIELEVWYTRAAFSSVAVWLALRYRFRTTTWLRILLLHLSVSLLLDALALLVMATFRHWSEPGRPTFTTALRQTVSMHIAFNLLVYWVLVGLVHIWHYYNDARKEEVRSARLRGELANARLTVLKAQLHPHFLFNALHSVATLLHEDVHAAEDLLLRLSSLLRVVLDDTHYQEISLRKEITILEWHLGIERIRYGDRLTTKTGIEDELLDCAVPHLILQTLVENAIRHGIGKHPGNDVVGVYARRAGESLEIEVTNSNSVLTTSQQEALREGIGLSNMKSRLHELYNGRSSLRLTNMKPRGVSAVVSIPYRRMEKEPSAAPEFFQ